MRATGGAMQDIERWADALATSVVDGVGVDAWSLCVGASRHVRLGIKDAEAGNPHAPLTLGQSATTRYLIVWHDGLVSRGHLERRQLAEWNDTARRIAPGASLHGLVEAQVDRTQDAVAVRFHRVARLVAWIVLRGLLHPLEESLDGLPGDRGLLAEREMVPGAPE